MISVAEARAISENNNILPAEVENYVSKKIMAAANDGEFSTSVYFSWTTWESKYDTYAKIAARMLKKEGYTTVLRTCSACAQSDLYISWDNM